MKANEIKTWKEFFNVYFDAENLTLEHFKDACRYTDVMENCETGEWPDAEKLFELYNSDDGIKVVMDQDDGINENDYLIFVYGDYKYCFAVTPEFAEELM